MNSGKRKLANIGFERRVRARADPEPEPEFESDHFEESNSDDGDMEEPNIEGIQSGSGDESGSDIDEEPSNSSDEGEATPDASSLSFGALARAQDALSSSKRHRSGSSHQAEIDNKAPPRKIVPKRSNKHVPSEMSSKRAVKRGRPFEAPKPAFRDPRFDPATTASEHERLDQIKAEKAYAFLHDYRASERESLRAALAKSKNERERAELGRALARMQSREVARVRKEEGEKVAAEHRRRERELVRQGKKPFYLKKAEQKKRVLLDRFAGMSAKQVDKAIEKKRKKLAAKERKSMPRARRGAAD